jgi:uncharacterized repeat protein (TIGR01451 family)
MKTKLRIAIFVVLVGMLVVSPMASPRSRAGGPWYVSSDGSDTNSCQSPAMPCATINGAITKADPGDTIYVALGTYTGSGDAVVLINKDVNLSGGWNGAFTTQTGRSAIDGQDARRGISIEPGIQATINRFVIQNGYTSSGGGGILITGASLIVINSHIRDNYAYGGGGGISISSYATLKIRDSAITGNVSPQWGGGVFSDFSTVIIENSTVSKNKTSSGGGGIVKGGSVGDLSLYSATISLNSAYQGGGIFALGDGVTLQNSLVAMNTSTDLGPDCTGSITSSGYNLLESNDGCDFSPATGDLLNMDPQLGAFIEAFGYQTLLPSSPAVDAGNPSGCLGSDGLLTEDQRGAARVGVCDIGSFEYTSPGPPERVFAYSGTPQSAVPSTVFLTPFQALVVDQIGSPVNNVSVLFSAPASGPSGTFADTGTITSTVLTDAGGISTATAFTANEKFGDYIVTAAVAGVIEPAQFTLANIVWYVTPTGNDENDCQSPDTPCSTVAGIVGKSGFHDGDTVYVAIGTYTGTGDQVVLLSHSVRLYGGWDLSFIAQEGMSTIDGEHARRGIVLDDDATALVKRFIIQNTSTGIWNHGEVLDLDHLQVSSNLGEGILNNGVLTLNHSEVSENSGFAGGIFNNGDLTIDNTSISGNEASNSGGGIYNAGHLKLNNTSISGNEAENEGGGIYNSGDLTLNNSTISGNSASSSGGGIYNYYGDLTVNSSTIGGNAASHTGGGISNSEGSAAQLHNTILADNVSASAAPDCDGKVDSHGYNLIGNTSGCTYTEETGDLLGTDPLLRPLVGSPGYHPLAPDSPAIDAGDLAGCKDNEGNPLLVDQRGSRRVGRCDIGAVEWQPLDTSFKQADPFQIPSGLGVSYVIALNNPGDSEIADLILTDSLPAEVTYIPGSLSAEDGDYSYKNGVVTWSGTVDAGSTIEVRFDAKVNTEVTLGSQVTNSAIIRGDGLVSDVSADFLVDGRVCNLAKYGGNPVLVPGPAGAWDSAGVWDPSVIRIGNLYHMWYAGADGSTTRIGYATSSDGKVWTKYAGNPVFGPDSHVWWRQSGVFAPNVIYDSYLAKYYMWYTGEGLRIGYVTSCDGINWPSRDLNPALDAGDPGGWEGRGVLDPAVVQIGDGYHMWYAGDDGISLRLGHATALPSGSIWDKDSFNPVLDLGTPGGWDWLYVYGPSVITYGEKYLLWYSGGTLPSRYQIGTAVSTDGVNWQRQGVILSQGGNGAFDEFSADYPAVLLDGSNFKIWYSGLNASGEYAIGYAKASVCPASASFVQKAFLPLLQKGNTCQASYYYDPFSDPNSGWPIDEDSDYKFAYTNGEYQIQIKHSDDGNAVTPGAIGVDFTASVTTRVASGDGALGIIFGINADWTQFYEVLLRSNQFSIWRYSNGWGMLKDWTASTAIQSGSSPNRLKVVREGPDIRIYANNQYLATVIDDSIIGMRHIGLVAESGNKPLDARFDDFALYPASCEETATSLLMSDFMGVPERSEFHEMPLSPPSRSKPNWDRPNYTYLEMLGKK